MRSQCRTRPPRYSAVRTPDWTYIRYATGEHEFYDRTVDPYMLDNIYDQLSPDSAARLKPTAKALSKCAGNSCRRIVAPQDLTETDGTPIP